MTDTNDNRLFVLGFGYYDELTIDQKQLYHRGFEAGHEAARKEAKEEGNWVLMEDQ